MQRCCRMQPASPTTTPHRDFRPRGTRDSASGRGRADGQTSLLQLVRARHAGRGQQRGQRRQDAFWMLFHSTRTTHMAYALLFVIHRVLSSYELQDQELCGKGRTMTTFYRKHPARAEGKGGRNIVDNDSGWCRSLFSGPSWIRKKEAEVRRRPEVASRRVRKSCCVNTSHQMIEATLELSTLETNV